jgi:hypothetical protein
MKFSPSINSFLLRKIATFVLLTASCAAFATLGEGGKKNIAHGNKNLLSARSAAVNYKSFTLRSGYNYRGSKLLTATSNSHNYIMLNNVIMVEKGNQAYILPMKRKVLLDRISFKPAPPRF